MARVVEVSEQELRDRRTRILASLDVNLEGLQARADAANLTEEEWDAWEELRNIAFLLGDD